MRQWFEPMDRILVEKLRNKELQFYGYNNFSNTGDQALWIALARHLSLFKTPSRKSLLRTSQSRLNEKEKEESIIIFPGGGSLGNRYKSSRRRIEFIEKNNMQFFQMPISTTFGDDHELLHRVKEIYQKKGTTFCRDAQSQKEAKKHLGIEATLVPDLAELLPSLTDFQEGGLGDVFLERRDGEASAQKKIRGVFTFDWPDLGAWYPLSPIFRYWNNHLLSERVPSLIKERRWFLRERMNASCRLSLVKTARALAFLSFYDRVFTDRLHGLILSNRLGMEVCYYDNDHGKISRYLKTWAENYRNASASE